MYTVYIIHTHASDRGIHTHQIKVPTREITHYTRIIHRGAYARTTPRRDGY